MWKACLIKNLGLWSKKVKKVENEKTCHTQESAQLIMWKLPIISKESAD